MVLQLLLFLFGSLFGECQIYSEVFCCRLGFCVESLSDWGMIMQASCRGDPPLNCTVTLLMCPYDKTQLGFGILVNSEKIFFFLNWSEERGSPTVYSNVSCKKKKKKPWWCCGGWMTKHGIRVPLVPLKLRLILEYCINIYSFQTTYYSRNSSTVSDSVPSSLIFLNKTRQHFTLWWKLSCEDVPVKMTLFGWSSGKLPLL